MASVFAVDRHPQKQQIIADMIAGKPLRDIAATTMPPLHFTALGRYKNAVVKPTLIASLAAKPKPAPLKPLATHDLDVVRETAGASATVPATAVQDRYESGSIVRSQLATVYGSTARVLAAAERKALDPDAAAADIGAHAQQARAALAGVELLGKLTGELQPDRGATSGPCLVVVMPSTINTPAYRDVEAIAEAIPDQR